jgi:hypothetical protein
MIVGDKRVPAIAVNIYSLWIKIITRMMGLYISATLALFQCSRRLVDIRHIVFDVTKADLLFRRQ